MQLTMFDGAKPFKIKKPIRLIELFAGYGSQHFALQYLKANFESWKICEWAVKSIQAYKDAHFSSDNTDYSKEFNVEQVYEYLYKRRISSNYNEPMTYEQIKRLGEQKARVVYNNIQATHNLVDIQQTHAKDLEIVDTDKYDYIMTYSFPCVDLSLAGLCKGMEKGAGTRSGLLWEVERILDECDNLPQILLMENVPEVIGTKNIKHFANWLAKLEKLGYHCYWQVLNAKDYGIPQNRERCFMISILGDYVYEFPEKQKLELKLKDFLETNVDEKYYLSENMKNYIASSNGKWTGNNGKSIINRDIGVTVNTRVGETRADCSDYICDELPQNYDLKQSTAYGCSIRGRYDENGKIKDNLEIQKEEVANAVTASFAGKINQVALKTKNKRLISMLNEIDITETQAIDIYNQSVHKEMHTIKTNVDTANMTAVTENLRIRKLTPKECFRLMGVKDEDYELIAKNQSNASLYHLAGDSIVVDVLVEIFKKFLN